MPNVFSMKIHYNTILIKSQPMFCTNYLILERVTIMSWKNILLAALFLFIFNIVSFAQVNDMPPPPLPDPVLLEDIFLATKNLEQQGKAIEFKEQVSFRLACVLPEGRQTRNIPDRNVDYRQSADYAVSAKRGEILERKLLETHQPPRFGLNSLFQVINIPTIQETLPPVASLKTAFLTFVSKDFVNGYKEVGKEKINKHNAIKLALRFRPGRISLENCFLWIDEQSHLPLQAELKIGTIGRYEHVTLKISLSDFANDKLPDTITQEVTCSSFERGIPIRLEHNVIYSAFKPLQKEE